MEIHNTVRIPSESARSITVRSLRVLGKALCLPIASTLLLLEPLVRILCSLGLVLGVLASILFELSAVGPRFPFLKVFGISLSFGLILFLYYGLLSLFVK